MRITVLSSRQRSVVDALLAAGHDVSVITIEAAAVLYHDVPVQAVESFDRLDQVLDVAAAAGVPAADAVLAVGELGVLPAAALRSYFGLTVPGPRLEVAARFADKAVMKSALAAAGLPVADHRVGSLTAVRQLCAAVGFPAVLKPCRGAGTTHTCLVRDETQLEKLIATGALAGLASQPHPVVAEAFVPMLAELHCDAVVFGGTTVFSAVSRYFGPLLQVGSSAVGSVVLPAGPLADSVAALSERAVGALGLRDGVTHVEVFDTADGLVVGEVAARPGGGGITGAVRQDSGVDLWRAIADVHLGQPPATGRGGPRKSGQVAAWCGLPARNGRVVRVTPASELAAIDGVTKVRLDVQPGQVLSRPAGSSFWAGVVHFRAPDVAAAQRTAQRVWSRFQLDVAGDRVHGFESPGATVRLGG
jgi:biotin carboxylase